MRSLIVTGLAVLYLPFVGAITRVAATDPYAGHVLFVPIVSALIVWRRWDRLRKIAAQGSPLAFLLFGAAFVLLVLAHTAHSYTAHTFSLVLAVAGVGLWLRGTEWLRQAAFPLGFLLLMLPAPASLIAAVTPTIQGFVASFTAGALSLLQVPVERQGLLLRLPNATVGIDESCNGLRFLLVLFVIVTAFAQLLIPAPSRRFHLMIAAIPAAVLANLIRVTEVALAAYLYGPQVATHLHDYIGRGTWLLTIATLLAWAIVLARTARQPRLWPCAENPQAKKV